MIKKLTINVAIGIILTTLFSLTYFKTNNTYSLTVVVNDLRNSKGIVMYSLYNKEGSIPDEKFKKHYKQKVASINKETSTVTFNNIPKGKYAINILHDENKNGKIDKGWIMPIEGIGFSNYTTIGLTNRPNFSKASFNLDGNIVKQIKVIYL